LTDPIWNIQIGDDPLVFAAIHDGHAVRDELAKLFAISAADRLREEDPYTSEWTAVGATRIIGLRSRFEVDLNRPRHTSVYLEPGDAWGLKIWHSTPPQEIVARSLAEYDAFYRAVNDLLARIADRHGRFVVYDLHSYNHQRDGADAPPADPADNPQVNVGTGSMNRSYWAPVVDHFISDLRAFPFPGGQLDVRENVKFRGGQLSRWVHETFPESGCAIAIEFKKFFMDEWTGKADCSLVQSITESLRSTVPGVLKALQCR